LTFSRYSNRRDRLNGNSTDLSNSPVKIKSNLLKTSSLIFWDFDGVIKDSIDVKTVAYERLFLPFGNEIANRVRQHHEENCGVSRFEKIPLYLEWAGQQVTLELIEDFCQHFSDAVMQAVIESPWVPGVREYLLKHYMDQYFVLVTATPQNEIEHILASLKLSHCFREIFGAPIKKDRAIAAVLDRLKVPRDQVLVIGDSESDLLAAQANSVRFLLRLTPVNRPLQTIFHGPIFHDLNYE
jgi:phosphoglycolate phosphatase-like HAD superfamily hydrolase